MANFDDLQFNKKPYGEGIQALIFFDNGYGASIIQGVIAYTSSDDEYELAVLKGADFGYLTPAEKGILKYLSLSNEEISKRRKISVFAVKNLVHSIIFKMEVNSRTEALVMALKEGLVNLNDVKVGE